VLVDLSVLPSPSVSSKTASTESETGMGLFHIQIPFVHAWVVEPTSKPEFLKRVRTRESLLVEQSVTKERLA